jgi:two-component system, chemotaxis family, chemotaxis protein CheY
MIAARADCLVLVVEDDHDARVSLRQALEDESYRVHSAAHGASAIAWLAHTPELPKVIVLDLWMPIMDGWQFVEALRSDPKINDLPIVVETATTAEPPAEIQYVIRKPIKMDELIAVIDRLCGLP